MLPARMRVHDVSLTLRPDMVTWVGEKAPQIKPVRRIALGEEFNTSLLILGDHIGTHVDPPVHFIEGAGIGIDALPVDALVGPCQVVGYEGDDHISQKWLEGAGIAPGIERLVFRTRNSERWADPASGFDKDFLALDETAAHWLVRRGIKLVGVDYLSIEPFRLRQARPSRPRSRCCAPAW